MDLNEKERQALIMNMAWAEVPDSNTERRWFTEGFQAGLAYGKAEIEISTKELKSITHGDTGKVGIKSLCGAKPNGVDYFTPVFLGEPLSEDIDCPKCREAFGKKNQF